MHVQTHTAECEPKQFRSFHLHCMWQSYTSSLKGQIIGAQCIYLTQEIRGEWIRIWGIGEQWRKASFKSEQIPGGEGVKGPKVVEWDVDPPHPPTPTPRSHQDLTVTQSWLQQNWVFEYGLVSLPLCKRLYFYWRLPHHVICEASFHTPARFQFVNISNGAPSGSGGQGRDGAVDCIDLWKLTSVTLAISLCLHFHIVFYFSPSSCLLSHLCPPLDPLAFSKVNTFLPANLLADFCLSSHFCRLVSFLILLVVLTSCRPPLTSPALYFAQPALPHPSPPSCLPVM